MDLGGLVFIKHLMYQSILIEGKEKEYLSWFIRGLEFNPSAITDADIDVFASHAKVPGGLRSQFEHFRAFPTDAEQNKESAKNPITMPVPGIRWRHISSLGWRLSG